MPDKKKDTLSPVETASILGRIDDRTGQLINIHIPRVEKIATESRNEVIKLGTRVSVLENIEPHVCDEKVRQARQDDDIADAKINNIDQKVQLKGLHLFRNYFIGIIAMVVVLVSGFAIVTRSIEATNTTNIDTNRHDIERHEKLIHELPRKIDIEQIVSKSAKQIPTNVIDAQKALPEPVPTADSVEDDLEELVRRGKMSKIENAWARKILIRVRKRENGEH